MRKLWLAVLISTSTASAADTISYVETLKILISPFGMDIGVGKVEKNGQGYKITYKNTIPQISYTLDGDGTNGKPLRNLTLVYEGPSSFKEKDSSGTQTYYDLMVNQPVVMFISACLGAQNILQNGMILGDLDNTNKPSGTYQAKNDNMVITEKKLVKPDKSVRIELNFSLSSKVTPSCTL